MLGLPRARVRWAFAATIGIVALAATAPVARADDALAEARTAVANSDYLAAEKSLDAALKAGSASTEDLADIYRMTGIVEGALGNAKEASAAFARWIAIDSKAALPAGTSPKIARPFSEAQAAARKAPTLAIKTETSADPPAVTIVVTGDPLQLVQRARVLVSADGGAEQQREAPATDRAVVELPAGHRLDLRVIALDSYGNHVRELGTRDVPIVITGADRGLKSKGDDRHDDPAGTKRVVHDEAPAHARPLWAKWWLWGGVAIAFEAGATYFGLQARDAASQLRQLEAQSQLHTFTEAQDVESRGKRDALLFNIGSITGGVLAAGAVVLYLTEPRVVRETRVSAVPTRGGGAVFVGGSF